MKVIRNAESLDSEKDITVLDRRAVFCDAGGDGARFLGFDFVHHLHRLDDAERLTDGNVGADFHEVRRIWRWLGVVGADHGRGDFRAIRDGSGGKSQGCGCGSRGMPGRSSGGERGEQTAEIIEIRAFLELEVEVPLREVEVGEPVLIHKLDDAADFLEFHGEIKG
jgi:hypothetical protein